MLRRVDRALCMREKNRTTRPPCLASNFRLEMAFQLYSVQCCDLVEVVIINCMPMRESGSRPFANTTQIYFQRFTIKHEPTSASKSFCKVQERVSLFSICVSSKPEIPPLIYMVLNKQNTNIIHAIIRSLARKYMHAATPRLLNR